jgi:hypothetical protein
MVRPDRHYYAAYLESRFRRLSASAPRGTLWRVFGLPVSSLFRSSSCPPIGVDRKSRFGASLPLTLTYGPALRCKRIRHASGQHD